MNCYRLNGLMDGLEMVECLKRMKCNRMDWCNDFLKFNGFPGRMQKDSVVCEMF